ncbi:MAG: hypothetical protein JO339_19760 [Alphaproteobacteria bacterium]|nr:hypothetical protein [Alphaproteobacteria bacterium]
MRIVFDGRQVESLEPKVARRIGLEGDSPLVEGSILSADQIVADAARRARFGFGVVGAVVGVILLVAALATLEYEPADIVVIGPLYAVILAAIGLAGPALYRRSLVLIRDKTERRLARLAPTGTAVRLDASGLTVGECLTPWSDITIEAVEIATEFHPDGDDDYHAEAVVLDVRGQPVVLDRVAIANGPMIVDKALRILGVDFR